MPIVTISMLEGNSIDFKNKVHDAIHSSLVSSFKIPDGDYNQKINEYDRSNWKIPEGRSHKFMVIEMIIFPGRSKDAKRELYKEIADRLERIGMPREDVLIVLIEQPFGNWGIRGGLPADEIDLGFKTDV